MYKLIKLDFENKRSWAHRFSS